MEAKHVESGSENSSSGLLPGWWTRNRKLVIGAVVFFLIALAIGLGVGLGVGLKSERDDGDDDSDDGSNGNSTPTGTGFDGPVPTTNPVANPTNIWQPTVGTSWDYQLGQKVNSTAPNNTAVWAIDLFETSTNVISGLQTNGAKVICYFSAGSWENWRSDAGNFSTVDLGKTLDGWPNEKWLNISSSGVRHLMLTRLDLARQKGCNGIDPDNVDGYNNDNGLELTQADSIDYMKWLAGASQARNMSIGLKNAGDIVPDVLPYMQWSVNEQCLQYSECDVFEPFITAGKPVFHVEYPKGDDTNNSQLVSASVKSKICDSTEDKGFSTIIKNINLDAFIETC